MAADIRRMLKDLGYSVAGDRIHVDLPGGRTQTLTIAERNGRVRFRAIAVSARAASCAVVGPFHLMLHNRNTELVDFTIDGRGRWIGETVVPAGSVSVGEVHVHMRALAAAADQMERVVTGEDLH